MQVAGPQSERVIDMIDTSTLKLRTKHMAVSWAEALFVLLSPVRAAMNFFLFVGLRHWCHLEVPTRFYNSYLLDSGALNSQSVISLIG